MPDVYWSSSLVCSWICKSVCIPLTSEEDPGNQQPNMNKEVTMLYPELNEGNPITQEWSFFWAWSNQSVHHWGALDVAGGLVAKSWKRKPPTSLISPNIAFWCCQLKVQWSWLHWCVQLSTSHLKGLRNNSLSRIFLYVPRLVRSDSSQITWEYRYHPLYQAACILWEVLVCFKEVNFEAPCLDLETFELGLKALFASEGV